MNETLTKLQTVSLSSTQSSVSFSNIPQTYTDLVVKISARSSAAAVGDNLQVTFNGSSSGYTGLRIYSNPNGGSSPLSYTWSSTYGLVGIVDAGNETGSTFSNIEMTIPNYTSNNYKIYSVDSAEENVASANAFIEIDAMTWANTAPITSMTFTVSTSPNTFASGSEFTLYGVKSLSNVFGNSIKATGGTITTDGTYVYHTFNTSGSFIPNTRLFADYLVIAGGGGSGASGAGAGGLRSTLGISGGAASPESQIQLLPGTSYSVVVGAGGSGSSNGQSSNGSNGNNSSFGTITAIGGGGGITSGGSQLNTGLTGGSGSGGYGGGDGTSNGSSAPGGSGTLGQGYAGGSSAPKASATSSSGGGGGAGAVGANAATTNTAGAGGNGVYLSGFSVATNTGLGGYYAGGGGGGYYVSGAFTLGGLGGGGAGSSANAPGSSGTSNTGGGAGGAYSESYKTAAYSGGSGLVVVRYKA